MPGGADDRNFTYDVFISYRHVERDRKWAEWLIAALESYRVPKSLQDRGYPVTAPKVFRDEDEIPASPDLNDRDKTRAQELALSHCHLLALHAAIEMGPA